MQVRVLSGVSGSIMTKKQAKTLGLKLQRLLCMDAGRLRRRRPDEKNDNIVYGLDGPQYMQRVLKKGRKPALVLTHPPTGLPTRPLYIAASGKVLRAVPIDWEWGVDYMKLRELAPDLVT